MKNIIIIFLSFITCNLFAQTAGNVPLHNLRHASGPDFIIRSSFNGQAQWVKDTIYFPKVFNVASSPLTAKKGDIWVSSANGNTYLWDGIAWQVIAKISSDTSAVNELIQSVSYSGGFLNIEDNGGTYTIDLRDTLFGTIDTSGLVNLIRNVAPITDSIDWANITNKPLSFNPSTHTHTINNVNNLQDSLLGKAPIVHNHTFEDIIGLQDSLNAKIEGSGQNSSVAFWNSTNSLTNSDRFRYDIANNNLILETTSQNGLYIHNTSNSDSYSLIKFRSGVSGEYRRYLEWLSPLGTRTNLMGFNAQNSFIVYDHLNTYHPIFAGVNATKINSFANVAVEINRDEGATGSGGLVVYNGAANATENDKYGEITNLGVNARGGRYTRAYSADNSKFVGMLSDATNGYVTSTNNLYMNSSGNSIWFAKDLSIKHRMYFGGGTDNRFGINNISPSYILDVNGDVRISNTAGTATMGLGRDANGKIVDLGFMPVNGTSVPAYANTAAAAADGALAAGSFFKVTNGDGTSQIHIKD